jgi:hypothetical protein
MEVPGLPPWPAALACLEEGAFLGPRRRAVNPVGLLWEGVGAALSLHLDPLHQKEVVPRSKKVNGGLFVRRLMKGGED